MSRDMAYKDDKHTLRITRDIKVRGSVTSLSAVLVLTSFFGERGRLVVQ